MYETNTLKNHFLLPMPQMRDPKFAKSLIYLVEHGEHGSMGLVVNRPNGLNLADLLSQLHPDETVPEHCAHLPVYAGGPMQVERGFVLHEASFVANATLPLGDLALTTSPDVLLAIAGGDERLNHHLVVLGCAAWDVGQLDDEVAQNVWLLTPASREILFDLPWHKRLDAAAAQLGISLAQIAPQLGHA